MSEFVDPTNFSGGRVSETTFMFDVTCWASHRPALRPTRGSALGVALWLVLGVDEHAAAETSPAASESLMK